MAKQQPAKVDEYLPVPVRAAQDIALQHRKSIVVILAWDRAFDRMHTTSYGVTAHDKIDAARLGEVLADAAGCDLGQTRGFEDFRAREAADWAVEREKLVNDRSELAYHLTCLDSNEYGDAGCDEDNPCVVCRVRREEGL